MKRVLVPFDGSPDACRAFEHAMRLASPQHGTWLHLLNVQAPSDRASSDVAENAALSGQLHDRGLAVLAEAEARAAAMGVPCELEVRIGDPDEAILAAAVDNGCHEIVLATANSGRGPSQFEKRTEAKITLVH